MSEKTAVSVFLYSQPRAVEWRPAVDVYRTRWGWLLKLDLAGVRMQDIRVQVGKRTVSIDGVRRDYLVEEGCFHHSMEIVYSRFQREIELPDDLQRSETRVEYQDGILYVRVRVKEGASE